MFPTAASGETLKRSLGNGDNGGQDQWSSLNGALRDNTDPAVLSNMDGRLEAFVVGTDNGLHHKWQNTAGATTNWSPYYGLGGIIPPNSDPAVIMNSDGRLQVLLCVPLEKCSRRVTAIPIARFASSKPVERLRPFTILLNARPHYFSEAS